MITKKYFGNLWTKNSMGLPCTPGKWKTKFEFRPITIICVSSCRKDWIEYVERKDFNDFQSEKLVEVTTIGGEKKLLNPRNIVSVRNAFVMSAIYHSENRSVGLGDIRYMFLTKKEFKVQQINNFEDIQYYY